MLDRGVPQASIPGTAPQQSNTQAMVSTTSEGTESATHPEMRQPQNDKALQPEETSESLRLTSTADQANKDTEHLAPDQPESSTSEKPSPNQSSKAQTTAGKDSWQYQWQTGGKYTYQFRLDYEDGGKKHSTEGTCYYRVGSVAHEPSKEELATTGTGFVVSADGYLVTCAHVVHQAASVKVTLGKQSWTGQVVAIDHAQDLAIVKIKAQSLPSLAISSAEDVVLAEPVRVVGYPLSSMLGKGVKITSGTVAGRTEENDEGARSFQIDASVNPGNSGGPIVDENGRVVGVASALLSGFKISEVGFAVPAQEVRRLLQKAGINPSEPKDLKPRSGPEIAEMVIPSVAYLEVQLDPKYQRSHWVEYNFTYQTHIKNLSPNSPRLGRLDSGSLFPIDGQGKFAITRFGEISRIEGKQRLPLILDPLGTVFVENLQHEEKKKWSASSITELQIQQSETLIQRMQRMQSRHEEKPTSLVAIEKINYQITAENPKQVTFTKEYECKSLEDKDPPTYIQTGTGTIVFDKKIGMPASMEFRSSVQYQNGEEPGQAIPYRLSYQLSSAGATMGDKIKAAIGSVARHMGAGYAKDSEKYSRKLGGPKPKPPKAARKPSHRSDPQRVDELLTQLDPKNSSDFPRHFEPDLSGMPAEHAKLFRKHLEQARRFHNIHRPSRSTELNELASLAVVAKKQQKVGEIFLHYLAYGDTFDQRAAIAGLANWATKKHVPGMILLLTKEGEQINWPERTAIIKALSKFKSPQVYRAIASRLMYFSEESDAQKALIAMGSDAERAVCEILDHKSDEARRAAAEILKEIGTSKSLPALNRALQDEPETFTRISIEDAIAAINGR